MKLALVEVIDVPDDAKHRFLPLTYDGKTWDLSHLDSFAFRCDPGLGTKIDVVVIFSCHCFTRSFHRDPRSREEVSSMELFDDGKEKRVLDPERYELSRVLLRNMATELPNRRIIIANEQRRNFMTWQIHNADSTNSTYGVFFDVERDTTRKGRVVLRIQSAYMLENGLTKRQKEAKKVSWMTLIKAAYEGRKIRP
jgi:hypothetical protein